jgi:hypothetical protein
MEPVSNLLNPKNEPKPASTERPVDYAAEPSDDGRTAIIVCHGMGQQVRFQTLNDVVQLLREEAHRRGSPIASAATRLVLFRDERGAVTDHLGRAEFAVNTAAGEQRVVHVYEAYWAPLTEGKVVIRDVLRFLLRAGWNGVNGSIHGVRRLMFQDWVDLKKTRHTLLMFLFALAVIASLAAINSALAFVLGATVLKGVNQGWPSAAAIRGVVNDIAVAEILGVPLAVLIGLLHMHRAWYLRRNQGTGRRWILPPVAGVILMVWTWIALAATVGVAVLIAIHLFIYRHARGTDTVLFSQIAVVAVIAFCLSLIIRAFLIQYVGDVVVYLSGHTVSRFNEIRDDIQRVGIRVGRAVFGLKQYERVILVGHSLGSVVAYDLYNRLVNETGGTQVQQRTKLLITFGSPLDKTAFVFRTQATREADVREALTAAVQPIIVDPANRPGRWVNIWSPRDWISGPINYYERPDEGYVLNVVDREATLPLVAHAEYWKNVALGSTLYDALINS